MRHIIQQSVEDSITVKKEFFTRNLGTIEACANRMADALKQGKKILLFGNGGSAADCQHIAAEFVNRFQIERKPLPAIALTTDTSIITSIGNDYAFEDIFFKQLQALGQKGDIALGISTSGNSPNVVKTVLEAKEIGLLVVGFSGKNGRLKDLSDIPFCVDSDTTARIQEVHILLAHILCDLTERILFHG
ncbi:MAG: D-sedoheptulose 7-phosphate isomerase [Proteobacteria bacterium]|nr:D-sedoheptulose 7-phosphate isomerase [Pseudomonadota bacterium]MBU1584048.1 D-sedoheptulose 7-phosphate isomerase [Pseudomonadota bacterium]MBU2631317.1 D-sedoheptulose 7-phosphate isomerase [Pseudomonadota bacterium]